MDKNVEQRIEHLLLTYPLEELLEINDLTVEDVVYILFEKGLLEIENEPL